MDARSRRKFVNEMMAATAMAMGGGMMFGQQAGQASGIHTIPEGGPPYLPMGGVQQGPDGVNGNPAPGAIGAPAAGGGRGGAGGGAARAPRPKPAGIFWISGTGTEKNPAATWDMKDHTKITMDNLKRGIEARGGTMESYLYMQVFFCLHLDDGEPMPKGSAAFAAYQKAYDEIGEVYYSSDYWPNGRASAPPRSCFALTWIPGSSRIEISAAAWVDPSVVPPPAAPRGGGGGGRRGGGAAPPGGAPPA